MKALNVFITVLVLTCFAILPLTAQADEDLDDLDVTMEVLDDETGLDDDIADMAGRRDSADDWEELEPGNDEEAGNVVVEEHYGEHRDGEFERIDEIDNVDEIDDSERDYEEGEDIEEDAFEDEPEIG
jgi:hypothetical protein